MAILLAIALELHYIRDQPPAVTGLRVTLAALTILLAWIFMNTIFALHYAHFFYGNSDAPAGAADARGLAFRAATSQTTGTSSTSPSSSA